MKTDGRGMDGQMDGRKDSDEKIKKDQMNNRQ